MFAKLLTFFIGLASSLPGRVMAALGLGYLSYQAISTKVSDMVTAAINTYTGIPTEVLQLLDLAGFTSAIGIITGCMLGKATLIAISKIHHFTTGV